MKSDLFKIFVNEIYSKPPMKSYETNKIKYNDIAEIWSIDLVDMIDYKTSNNKWYRYMFALIYNFSKHVWTNPLKNHSSKTKTGGFSNILTSSKRRPIKLQSDKGSDF